MQSFELDTAALGLLADYVGRPEAYDEMRAEDGRLRDHWRRLLERLAALGGPELARRWQQAQHLIHENGVTYNVYGDPQGMERPWNLSPVPVLAAPDEWERISDGIAQRAELFEALLADLYGPGRSLTSGLLPAEIVFGHPSFLRAIHGISVPQGRWLTVYGADLVRAPDGTFRVIEDGTQAPAGAGYALENRIVIWSILPDIFRECNVQRLAAFFETLKDTLEWLAPYNRDNPRMVLLTSGPSNATYFEQAYLAQYLGLTLVDGGDLTVRDHRVFLKTLGGLQPVDVILRRVNDDFCDPLELRPSSVLGVPGLIQAWRAGNVALCNPLGSGLVQTPALLPYLPALCRQLLDQDLILPSVRTWWCGDPRALTEVTEHFDRLVIKSTFPDGLAEPIFTATLASAERDALIARIRHSPEAFVAQEYLVPSTTPVMVDGKLEARPLVLGVYAVATQPRGYVTMPGGLPRVADAPESEWVSMQRGARSKDLWVVSDEQSVRARSRLRTSTRALELSRGGGDLPSRVADNLYWLGRYAERAESVARLARVIAVRLSDLNDESELLRSTEFTALLGALTAQTEFLYSADIPEDEADTLQRCEDALVSAVCDAERVGSLGGVIKSTLRAGRVVRDRISMDTWRVLATLDEEFDEFRRPSGPDRLGALVHLLNRVVVTIAAFSGLAMDSMSRGQAFHFLDTGRRLERGITLVTLLRATTTRRPEREAALLEAVLEIADSGMTYRRRYLATVQAAPVVDLVLTDETNPRSVMYQVRALVEHIRPLPLLPGTGTRSPQLRLAVAILNELELAEVEHLCLPDDNGERPLLQALLRKLGTQLSALSDSLSDSYLSHATVSRHLRQDELRIPRRHRDS